MEEDKDDLKDVVLEELKRLGVQVVSKKKAGGTQGSRLLGINTSSNISGGSSGKNKAKNKRSPRISRSRSPHSKLNANRARDERKLTPKSPFSSSKRKAELRKQNANKKNTPGQVFGQNLGDVPSVCVYMTDGTQVTVPEFLVDVCNLIRRNITVEGIFRKAGSSQRQSDLKKLIDNSNSLPTNIHVIDGACLLKQFLRCLPEPLLSSEVHSKIVKCMELNKELRVEAVTLCILLLPQTHRHTLMYLLDLLSEVTSTSGCNLMDAHNLAIVLAPNLLPTTFTPTSSRKNALPTWPSEDALLTTNIEIMQLMIENAAQVCRMPTNLALAMELREKSRSTENLLNTQQAPATRKKRRSASIHRLMTGLRRVVGHSSGSGSPLRTTGSVEYLDTLHLHPGVTLSPAPILDASPRKRKSADAFDLCAETPREATSTDSHQIITPPSNKRVKVESEVGTGRSSVTTAKPLDNTPSVVSKCPPIAVNTNVTPGEKQSSSVGESLSVREIKDSWNVFAQSFPKASHLHDSKSNFSKSLSTKTGVFSKSPGLSFHAVHGGLKLQGADRIEPVGQTKAGPAYTRAYSQIFDATPVKRPAKVKRRSCDLPLTGGAKRAGNFEEPVRVMRRSSLDWRITSNEPDGADVCMLGPRGVPDGAECNLRDGKVPKPTLNSSIDTLEQHYDDIKAVVKTMEAEVDKTNVQQMKDTFFPNHSSASQNMSYSEMIQSAYERMKVESKDLGISPSQSLSKRLDKELKIRNRKSSEHRVMRSPSERKIGTIRRRSRELVQNAAKSLISVEDTPRMKVQETPKMKEHLMQTPVNTSLRRGKPNSVKSGLPFVVRSFSPMQSEETSTMNASRMVVVNKRVDDSNILQPLKVTNRSPYQQVSSYENSISSDADIKGSLSDLVSLSLNTSSQSTDENLMDSILELLPGAITRRRSSLLSSLSSSFQLMNRHSTGGLEGNQVIEKSQSYPVGTLVNTSHDQMEVEEAERLERSAENLKNESAVRALPVLIMSESEEDEYWVPATEFQYNEEQEVPPCSNTNGRPSLAALIKQKKVTANVQLFNNLQTVTPNRRQTNIHLQTTPKQPMPHRSAASERRNARLSYSKSLTSRGNMTPRELLKARQRSFQFDRSPHNLTKIAVVSPLKESTWINIQQEHSQEVAKAFRGEATIPKPSGFIDNTFKPPVAPVTPGRTQTHKSFVIKPEVSTSNPPKLPPRTGVKPSPIRVQYR